MLKNLETRLIVSDGLFLIPKQLERSKKKTEISEKISVKLLTR